MAQPCLGCGLYIDDTGGISLALGDPACDDAATQGVYCTADGTLGTDAGACSQGITTAGGSTNFTYANASGVVTLAPPGDSFLLDWRAVVSTSTLTVPAVPAGCRDQIYDIFIDYTTTLTHAGAAGVVTTAFIDYLYYVNGVLQPTLFSDYSQETGTKGSNQHEHFVLHGDRPPGSPAVTYDFAVRYFIPPSGVGPVTLDNSTVYVRARPLLIPRC